MLDVILLLALVGLTDTFTVDDDGPADFASLAAALEEATDGDVLVVHRGDYAGVTVTEAVSFLAAPGERPRIHGSGGGRGGAELRHGRFRPALAVAA